MRTVGESACRFSVTSMPLTETAPTRNTAPSPAVTANRVALGRFAAVSSSASSKAMVRLRPAAGTLAVCGTGPAMSAVVASSTFDGRPRPELLMANTR